MSDKTDVKNGVDFVNDIDDVDIDVNANVDIENELNLNEDVSSLEDEDCFDINDMPSPEMGMQMMHNMLASLFTTPPSSDREPVNLAEAIMEVKSAIDRNSKCILKLHKEMQNLVPKGKNSGN